MADRQMASTPAAQPSPGGQGEARAQFEAWAESEGYHVERRQRGNVGDYSRAEVSELWGMWQLHPQQLLDAAKRKATSYGRASVQDGASCAGASQAGHSGHVRDARKALNEALAVMSAKAALAARQPVAEYLTELEAAAKRGGMDVCERDDESGPFPLLLVWSGTIKPVSPPAQAVDLCRARASIQSLLNWIDDWAETPEESGIDAIEAEAEAVLALIDSHSGVSRD